MSRIEGIHICCIEWLTNEGCGKEISKSSGSENEILVVEITEVLVAKKGEYPRTPPSSQSSKRVLFDLDKTWSVGDADSKPWSIHRTCDRGEEAFVD